MGLDARGDIAIVLIIVYIPIFCIALALSLRHGFGRQSGWIYLFTFSVVRILGGILHIAAELKKPADIGLYIGAFVLETAGVAPLLLCTSSLLQSVGEGVRLAPTQAYRFIRLFITVGFILAIVGAVNSTNSNPGSASTLRKAGALILLVSLIIFIVIDAVYWQHVEKVRRVQVGKYMLLLGVTLALPFLVVRLIYTCLSSFSPPVSLASVPTSSASASGTGLSRFNSITGDWWIFLIMSLLMEIIVVAIYLFFGMRLPHAKKGDKELAVAGPGVGAPMRQQQGMAQGGGRERNEMRGMDNGRAGAV